MGSFHPSLEPPSSLHLSLEPSSFLRLSLEPPRSLHSSLKPSNSLCLSLELWRCLSPLDSRAAIDRVELRPDPLSGATKPSFLPNLESTTSLYPSLEPPSTPS